MKRTGKALLGTVLLVLAGSIAGCGLLTKSYNYSETDGGIYVNSDATVKAAMVSEFDKDYYSEEELAGVAQQQVLDFNKTNYGCSYFEYDQMTKEEKSTILLPVAYDSIKKQGNTVSLLLEYANGDTYSSFNAAEIAAAGGTKLYTSVLENNAMSLEGISFVTEEGEQVSTEEILKKKNYCLAYTDYPAVLFGQHDIAYVSTNVSVLGVNCAKISGTDGAYVIFK